ncbi:MAG: Dipeptidyl aminopeptidase BIII [Candidatus Anoxychlamydiales bacterium]|nr:Dipeptidyl aminopeptidase BIII [Candidatus Anoxychlamydiales bacterium]
MKNKILACLTLIFCVFTIQISAQVRKEIPLKDFFKNPDKAAVKISPNGKYISYLEPWQSRLNVFVKNLDTNEIRQITTVTKRDILFYDWKGDDSIIYMQDNAGDENFHIYSASLNSNEIKDLTPFKDVRCSVIDMLEDIDNKILIQMNKRNDQVFDVYKLDVITKEAELVEKNPGDVVGWLSDHDGNIRISMAITDGTNQTLYTDNPVTTFTYSAVDSSNKPEPYLSIIITVA